MDYWVKPAGDFAIWYKSTSSHYAWYLGMESSVGSLTAAIYSISNSLEKKCPNNEGYVWNWMYSNNGFHTTNDVYIKCANEDDFCTSENPCGTNEGDCDTHDAVSYTHLTLPTILLV